MLEARRKIAARLFAQGKTLTEVAASVGCSVSSASRWKRAWERGGLKARVHDNVIRVRDPDCRRPSKRSIADALKQGTRHWGYSPCGLDLPAGAGLDSATVRRGVSRGLCGYAASQARLESAEAGAACPRTQRTGHRPLAPREMAAAKKRASNGKLAWFFSTKAAILLQPLRRRVWAPAGQTPVQHAWDRHDRVTAMAALTRAPWAERFGLYYNLLDHNARTPDVAKFLRERS